VILLDHVVVVQAGAVIDVGAEFVGIVKLAAGWVV
jgi:hypothetical protein